MIESVEVVVRQPGFPDRVVKLHEGATRIGRSEDNELVLSDVGVSRRHSQVYWSGAECVIEDLGSGNGTYHRGVRITSQPLADGDEVVIDPFVLSFRVRGGARQAETPPPAPTHAPARLDVIVGTGMAGASYPIGPRGLSIGRSEDRDVVIPDPAASRHHCQISQQGDRYVLRDMGSANGVFVNSVRVREQPLEDGDIVRIGNTEMRFGRNYDGAPNDLTTQVGPVLPLPQAAGAYTGQSIVPSAPPQAQVRQRGGSSIWLWLTAAATLAGMGLLVVIVALVVTLAVAWQPAPVDIPARAPHWILKLPAGLEGGTTDSLFNAGVEKMRKEDYRGALQDFYRVLQADPGARNAKKFALAAGEAVVLSELDGWLRDRARAEKERVARRDTLIARYKRGGRTARTAEASLIEEFREDPVAIREMGWSPTDAMVKRADAVKRAAAALAEEKWADAANDYDLVLAGSPDATERVQALAGMKTARRELAREAASAWRLAEVQAVTLGADAAKATFDAVRAADPGNPCARLQPR